MRNPERLSRALSFMLESGLEVFPYQVADMRTRRVGFRISPGGKGGNRVDATELVDEPTMLERVLRQGWAVRCRSLDGTVGSSQYKIGHRAVAEVRRA